MNEAPIRAGEIVVFDIEVHTFELLLFVYISN